LFLWRACAHPDCHSFLHDALPICTLGVARGGTGISSYAAGDLIYASGSTTLARRAIGSANQVLAVVSGVPNWQTPSGGGQVVGTDRKSTRLNSSHVKISYAVFCLK